MSVVFRLKGKLNILWQRHLPNTVELQKLDRTNATINELASEIALSDAERTAVINRASSPRGLLTNETHVINYTELRDEIQRQDVHEYSFLHDEKDAADGLTHTSDTAGSGKQ